jgi:hypothetical protein
MRTHIDDRRRHTDIDFHADYPAFSKPIDVKIDSIFMLLPDKFANPHNQQYDTLCAQCLLTEIERLNAFLRFLSAKLSGAMEEAKAARATREIQIFVNEQMPASTCSSHDRPVPVPLLRRPFQCHRG